MENLQTGAFDDKVLAELNAKINGRVAFLVDLKNSKIKKTRKVEALLFGFSNDWLLFHNKIS